MQINLRNIFTRMQPTQQDIRTLHGVITSIAEGRKGPARGGVLDGRGRDAAHAARRIRPRPGAERARAGARAGATLRRNPTDAERLFWDALTKDRRFAGKGFKRQAPVGPHITDVVSFPLRLTVELVPADESAEAAKTRAERHAWLAERDYQIFTAATPEVEVDVGQVLDRLAAAIANLTPSS